MNFSEEFKKYKKHFIPEIILKQNPIKKMNNITINM